MFPAPQAFLEWPGKRLLLTHLASPAYPWTEAVTGKRWAHAASVSHCSCLCPWKVLPTGGLVAHQRKHGGQGASQCSSKAPRLAEKTNRVGRLLGNHENTSSRHRFVGTQGTDCKVAHTARQSLGFVYAKTKKDGGTTAHTFL